MHRSACARPRTPDPLCKYIPVFLCSDSAHFKNGILPYSASGCFCVQMLNFYVLVLPLCPDTLLLSSPLDPGGRLAWMIGWFDTFSPADCLYWMSLCYALKGIKNQTFLSCVSVWIQLEVHVSSFESVFHCPHISAASLRLLNIYTHGGAEAPWEQLWRLTNIRASSLIHSQGFK